MSLDLFYCLSEVIYKPLSEHRSFTQQNCVALLTSTSSDFSWLATRCVHCGQIALPCTLFSFIQRFLESCMWHAVFYFGNTWQACQARGPLGESHLICRLTSRHEALLSAAWKGKWKKENATRWDWAREDVLWLPLCARGYTLTRMPHGQSCDVIPKVTCHLSLILTIALHAKWVKGSKLCVCSMLSLFR